MLPTRGLKKLGFSFLGPVRNLPQDAVFRRSLSVQPSQVQVGLSFVAILDPSLLATQSGVVWSRGSSVWRKVLTPLALELSGATRGSIGTDYGRAAQMPCAIGRDTTCEALAGPDLLSGQLLHPAAVRAFLFRTTAQGLDANRCVRESFTNSETCGQLHVGETSRVLAGAQSQGLKAHGEATPAARTFLGYAQRVLNGVVRASGMLNMHGAAGLESALLGFVRLFSFFPSFGFATHVDGRRHSDLV